MSFIEELLKTKSILSLLNSKIEEGSADLDVIEVAMATKMLENKLSVLNALNISVDGDGEDKVSFNLIGSGKSIVIDKAKMREAITIQENAVEEKAATADNSNKNLPAIETEGLTEE